MALTVACCWWGDWPAPGWGETYIRRLRDGVARHLAEPHRFVCFADRALPIEGVEFRPLLAPSWAGCLPKLFVYSPEAGLSGRVLLFDLDNVIVGDLSGFAAYRGPLAVRAWFAGYDRGERVADGDMIGFEAGGPVARRIWSDFTGDVAGAVNETGGRERWWLRKYAPDLWQDVLGPKAVLSYKRHCRSRPPPPECSVVSFHDKGAAVSTCRPHQVSDAWVREAWGEKEI